MTEIEEYLTGYYYAIQNLRRLTNELVAAERTYKDGIAMYPGHDFEAIRSKNKKILRFIKKESPDPKNKWRR